MSTLDFRKIADEALKHASYLLTRWFPHGKIAGDEFMIGDLSGQAGNSLKVNMSQGIWKDFSELDRGGRDLISLRAAMDGISQSEAARRVADEVASQSGTQSSRPAAGRNTAVALAPVPNDAPTPHLKVGTPHFQMRTYELAAHWAYTDRDGNVVFYTTRFENPAELTAKGKPKKVFSPLSYYGKGGWRFKGWGRPYNPLYGLDRLAARPDDPVLLVEGEKTADAAAIIFSEYVVVSWPGGTGQLGKADLADLGGRDVVYCPDADAAGRQSISLVASKLAAAGAKSLHVVETSDHLPDGWDLADEAPDGVEKTALLAGASLYDLTEEVFLQDLKLEDLFLRFAYDVGTEQFIDKQSGRRFGRSQMDALYQHKQLKTSAALLGDDRLPKVQRLTYKPGDETRIIPEGDGLKAYNLWRPSRVTRTPGDVTPFVEHLRYLCRSVMECEHLVNMLAFIVQTPGGKLKSGLVIVGRQGTGKSLVAQVMRELVGPHNTAQVTSTQVRSEFNQYMEGKQLVIVEEIMTVGRIEVMNQLKPLITETTVTINAKHLRAYEIENLANFVFLTNYEDALRINNDDRRYFIVMNDSAPHPKEYYEALWPWTWANLGVILDWLLSRDLSGFSPDARPPVTEGKLRMVEASRDETETWLAELIEDRKPPFDVDLVELNNAHRSLRTMMSGSREASSITRPKLAKTLAAVGAVNLGQQAGVVDGVAVRKSLWAVREQPTYQAMTPQDIIAHFVASTKIDAAASKQYNAEMKF